MANKTVTVKSSGGDYTSLAAALAGESADLVTGTCLLTIECYAKSDTAPANTGTGYTTNSSYHIKITSPAGERHAGAWSTSKYRLETDAWDVCFKTSADYTETEFIQFSMDDADSGEAVYTDASTNGGGSVSQCIIRRPAASKDGTGIAISKNCAIENCIIYGSSITFGIIVAYGSNVTSYIYNCTIGNGTVAGIYNDYGTTYAKNCVVFNTADDFYDGNGTLDIDYCASDDADGTNHVHLNENASGEWDDAFTDYANGDFSLAAGGLLCDAGTDLSAYLTIDIAGTTRDGTWDIGAFNYTAAATDVEVSATKVSLALATYDTGINAETSITADSVTLTLTKHAADVNLNVSFTAVVKELTLTTYAPGINAEVSVAATCATVTITPLAATVKADHSVSASCAALTATTHAPKINYAITVDCDTATMTLTQIAASIKYDVGLFADCAALTLRKYAATIDCFIPPLTGGRNRGLLLGVYNR